MTAVDDGVAEVLAASPWRGHAGLRWRLGVPAVASPMCQAVEWSNWIVTDGEEDEALFLKILQPELAGFIDPTATYAGALHAAALGIGPQVRFFLPEHGAIAFAHMPPPWRSAWLADLGRADVMAAAIGALRLMRGGPVLPARWDVFKRVGGHIDLARSTATTLPQDMATLLVMIEEIRAAFEAAGQDNAPCHNDGQATSFLLHPGGRVMLVDFDCAGQADPHYDLAVFLNEVCTFEEDWRMGIEMDQGRCDARVLNRCRAYAVADDLRWGLWGLILSQISPRRELEFLKFGEWRLLRCRMGLREPGFSDRLHQL